MTAMMRNSLKRKLRCMLKEIAPLKLLKLLFRRVVGVHDARDGAAGDLYFQIVWLNSQYQRIIVDRHDGTDDAARGEYRLPVLKRLQHLFRRLLLTPHGHEYQKVKDSDHSHYWQKAT